MAAPDIATGSSQGEHVISLYVNNKPGVLVRVALVFGGTIQFEEILDRPARLVGAVERNEGEADSGHADESDKSDRSEKKGRNLFIGHDDSAASGKEQPGQSAGQGCEERKGDDAIEYAS